MGEGGGVLLGGGDPQVCGHLRAGSAQERAGTVLEHQESWSLTTAQTAGKMKGHPLLCHGIMESKA